MSRERLIADNLIPYILTMTWVGRALLPITGLSMAPPLLLRWFVSWDFDHVGSEGRYKIYEMTDSNR